jgi:hypothetical protein
LRDWEFIRDFRAAAVGFSSMSSVYHYRDEGGARTEMRLPLLRPQSGVNFFKIYLWKISSRLNLNIRDVAKKIAVYCFIKVYNKFQYHFDIHEVYHRINHRDHRINHRDHRINQNMS